MELWVNANVFCGYLPHATIGPRQSYIKRSSKYGRRGLLPCPTPSHERKIWSWVLQDPELRMIVLERASGNLPNWPTNWKPWAIEGGVNKSEAVEGESTWMKQLSSEVLGRALVIGGRYQATSMRRSNRVESAVVICRLWRIAKVL
jgi:hypothetical protein